MKKYISICLALALAFSLAACGGGTSSASSTDNSSSDTVEAESPPSGTAEPTPESTTDNAVLRDMSADIANPNTKGCSSYDLAATGFTAVQNDWLYYVNGAGIHRTLAQSPDFTAGEMIWASGGHLNLDAPCLNVAGKYLYFSTNDTMGGWDLRQYDMETGELTILDEGDHRYYSVFYLDGYLYYSVTGPYSANYEAQRLMRMAVPCTDGTSATEELLIWPENEWHYTYNQRPTLILGTYNGKLLLQVNINAKNYVYGTVEGTAFTTMLETGDMDDISGVYLQGDVLVGHTHAFEGDMLVVGDLTDGTFVKNTNTRGLYNIYPLGDADVCCAADGISLMVEDKRTMLSPDPATRTVPVGDRENGGILYRPVYDNSSLAPLYFAPYNGTGVQKVP